MGLFEKSSVLPFERDDVFQWHTRSGALERLSPPWQDLKLVRSTGGSLQVGSEVELEMKIGPFWKRWIARHTELREGHLFVDEQIRGPFSKWIHRHSFESCSGGCRMTDQIEFEVPLSLGLADSAVQSALERAFIYRHQTLRNDLQFSKIFQGRVLRILISGASGLVGGALTAFLQTSGHEVYSLGRKERGVERELIWNPNQGFQDLSQLENFDVVIHLAGENISKGRWTEELKQELYTSRIVSTKNLVSAFGKLKHPPKTFICASAVGFYGNRGDEILNEGVTSGENYLAKICRDWELEAQKATALGIRSAQMRIGVVLSPKGGALQKMLTPFKIGLGGVLGPGTQYVSWISLDDLIYSFAHVIANSELSGPINAVAPHPVTFREYSKTLAHVLHRPLGPPVPAIVLRAIAGQLADELLLASIRAEPSKLLGSGFNFSQPNLEGGLRHILGLHA